MSQFTRLAALSSLILLTAVTGCAFVPRAAQSVAELTTQAAELFASATAIPTQTYVVQPGDTPKGVALMFGTTVEVLIELNADTHPEMGWMPMKFNAGWRLRVPAHKTGSADSGGNNFEVAQPPATVVVEVVSGSIGIQVQDVNGGSFDYEGALEIIQLANAERTKINLGALTLDESLMEIARKRATEIVIDWGHQGLDDDCSECGENIVKGGNVTGQFQWWINSEGHRGGILWPDYTATGVGRFIVNGKAYAVQLFR